MTEPTASQPENATSPAVPKPAAPASAERESAAAMEPERASEIGLLGRWRPIEALGSWLIPGLGHVVLGQTRRGIVIGVTVLTLWVLGLLIGGVGVVNRENDHAPLIWIGQYILAPSLVIDLAHRNHVIGPDAGPMQGYATPTPMFTYRPSFGRANEHGVLFTSVAGLLNLMAILDVLYIDDKTIRRWRAARRRARLYAGNAWASDRYAETVS